MIRVPQSDQQSASASAVFRAPQEAIIVEDLPGFVPNRISHLFMNEAAFVLQDNVATAEKIDMIFKKCFGHRMGPLETADLIGLDTVMRSLDVLYESFKDPKYRCCPLLRKLVHAAICRRTERDVMLIRTKTSGRVRQPARVWNSLTDGRSRNPRKCATRRHALPRELVA